MSKVHGCLLLTLVFSTAHAPTFELLRHLPLAQNDATFASPPARASTNHTDATFNPASLSAAPRELAEEDDLKRFQLDELNLPNLDVTLPELFEWSDIEREYLADAGFSHDRIGFALDTSRGIAFRSVGRNGGFGSTSANGGGLWTSSEQPTVESIAANTDPSGQTSKGGELGDSESVPTDTSSNEPPPTDGEDPVIDPIFATTPPLTEAPGPLDPVDPEPAVPVPAPGTLGLFVLGLAGLRLAGRNKKSSG